MPNSPSPPLPVALRLRPRVVLTTLSGVVPLALFVQWSDLHVGGAMSAGPYPPLAACLLWSLLFGANALISRIRRKQPPFDRGEMLIILAVWATANMVVGRGLLHPLLASLAGPIYYARSAAVVSAVRSNIPDWLALKDRPSAVSFFEGYGVPVPWSVWAGPLLTWSLFFAPFLLMNLCLCALFERLWIRSERLTFPLVSLPVQALHWNDARTGSAGFRRAFAFGIAIPLLLHGFGILHAYAPAVPCVPFFNDVSDLVTTPPWTALRPLYLNFYPLLVGITFLAPADVTFSVWFFLILNKIEQVITAAAGWNEGASGSGLPTPPFVEEQSAGAFLALAGVLVWNARRHLRAIGGTLWPYGRRNVAAGPAELREYRIFAIGFLAAFAAVLLWCVRTGMPLWFSAGYFGFYLAVALVLSRLMAESGVSWLLAPILPDKLLLSMTGSAALSHLALTRLTLHVQHLRDTRQMLMPAVFQAGKLRDEAGAALKPFYILLLGAIVLALVVGTTAALPIFYRTGALAIAPNSDGVMMAAVVIPTTGINQLSSRLLTPVKPSPAALLAVCAGVCITFALSSLRTRFLWWPLHPLGYALTGTLQIGYANKMLFSVFIGWIFKTLTLRFGGNRGFRMLRGMALGLILGDILIGGVLKLLDALLGPSGYAIF